jgi:hypothetical protein
VGLPLKVCQIAFAFVDFNDEFRIWLESAYLGGIPAARRPLVCENGARSLFGGRS